MYLKGFTRVMNTESQNTQNESVGPNPISRQNSISKLMHLKVGNWGFHVYCTILQKSSMCNDLWHPLVLKNGSSSLFSVLWDYEHYLWETLQQISPLYGECQSLIQYLCERIISFLNQAIGSMIKTTAFEVCNFQPFNQSYIYIYCNSWSM